MLQRVFKVLPPCGSQTVKAMDFQQVAKGLEAKTILLVDVRNPDELTNVGKIPGSVNLPLPELKESLQLPDVDFQTKFGYQKPQPKDPKLIVITCRSGARAQTAEAIFKELGYENTKIYSGSFLDWTEKGGHVER